MERMRGGREEKVEKEKKLIKRRRGRERTENR